MNIPKLYNGKCGNRFKLAAGIGLIISLPMIGGIIAQENDHSHTAGHSHNGRFSMMGDMWPPQPANMEDIVWLSGTDSNRTSSRTRRAVHRMAASESDQLGQRYVYIGSEPIGGQGASPTEQKLSYFSYSNNYTVEMVTEGETVLRSDTFFPEVYQPPLVPEEVTQAVDIARQAFRADGYSEVETLEGYGILAFDAAGDTGFYDTRMVYVSFHADIDARPEYVAWVDLTDQFVTEKWEE